MTRVKASILAALLISGAALAQPATTAAAPNPQPLTLQAALDLVQENDVDVLNARAALTSAQRDLGRTNADPQALGLDIMAAEQAVAAADDTLSVSLAAARASVADAYTKLLEAARSVERAELEASIAATTLEATRVKAGAGAATEIEVTLAETSFAAAQRAIKEAVTSRDLATEKLQSLIAQEIGHLQPIAADDIPDVPTLDLLLEQASLNNARLKSARRAVATTSANLTATDHAFSAQAQIDAAREAVDNAKASLKVAEHNLQLTLRQAYANVTAASNRLLGTETDDAVAARTLQDQEARLRAGSISPLAFKEAELSRFSSASSLAAARHALLLAVLQLQLSALQ